MTAKEVQNKLTTLLDLPDVVAHHIVDLIGFRPSLGLRRVCKTTQYWVDTHPNPLKEQKLIVLDTTEKLIQFNNEVRTLPLKHFQLGPFNSNKYPWPELQTFPNPLVQGMRTLHLKVLNCCESKVETDFMEQFTSLSHLTIGLLEKSQKDSDAVTLSKELSNVSLLSPSLPRKGLINLTRLSFGRVNSTLYFMDLIRSCPNLQHIDLPSLLILPVNIDAPTLFYNVYEKSLMEYVCDSSTKSLREINFNCSNPLRFTGNNNNNNRAFEERFILALHDKHVKLSNIPMSTVYSVFKAHESRMFEIFKQLVVSVVGVWPSSHNAPCFPNVENFIYDTSSGLPSNGNLSYGAFKNELYPKVNTITAKVYDPRNYAEYEYYNRVNLLLFDKEKRPDIEHLDLQIRTTAIPGFYGDPNTHRRNQIILVPADICFNKFPNLKTLRLTQTQIFTQNPRHYSGLFRALGFCTAIHTLHISTPSALTSHAVNGIHNWGDPTSIPSFQLMRTLRKFTLHVCYDSEAESNPRVPKRRMLEDRVMRTFKDTNLEWLEFTGVNYSNVTAEGLMYLLTGTITDTIETFIFDVYNTDGSKCNFARKLNVTVDNIDTICWRNRQKKLNEHI